MECTASGKSTQEMFGRSCHVMSNRVMSCLVMECNAPGKRAQEMFCRECNMMSCNGSIMSCTGQVRRRCLAGAGTGWLLFVFLHSSSCATPPPRTVERVAPRRVVFVDVVRGQSHDRWFEHASNRWYALERAPSLRRARERSLPPSVSPLALAFRHPSPLSARGSRSKKGFGSAAMSGGDDYDDYDDRRDRPTDLTTVVVRPLLGTRPTVTRDLSDRDSSLVSDRDASGVVEFRP